ncbi:cellulose binding domain-containing protein [Catellatospora tritici]|uniref:cellulose binding domain-containing protein n=1 Tax=Catellatospora tritici TaxID=2851566 RepID=UPI001C2D52BB|nr:cellulose binding domain-containing protein [Catellatospora tritici]MBV1849452.1 cellulose binding domain-containing protein [Catellatospora tritici]MBV1854024.1 cellulose binding domain-containing protein [Catellatospora tritici]
MTVLRLDVELAYPVELVWQALTERRLLSEWFLQTDLAPVPGATYHAYPAPDLPGFTAPFEVDVVDAVPPHRLVLRWRGEQTHSDVVWELSTSLTGCRLRISQGGFLGLGGQLRRAELHRAYQLLFEQRLPELLERLSADEAAGPVRRRRSVDIYDAADMPRRPPAVMTVAFDEPTEDAPPAATPLTEPAPLAPDEFALDEFNPGKFALDEFAPDEFNPGKFAPGKFAPDDFDPGDFDRGEPPVPPRGGLVRQALSMPVDRRLRLLSVVAAMVLTILAVTALATLILRPPGGPAVATGPGRGPDTGVQAGPSTSGSDGTGSPAPSTAPTPSPSVAASPSPSAAPSSATAPPTLTATYRTTEDWGDGYIGAVTIEAGSTAVDGWTAVLELPDGAEVTSAWDRVQFQQSGRRVVFTPQPVHRRIEGGTTFTLSFQVGHAANRGRPDSCSVDGVPCG